MNLVISDIFGKTDALQKLIFELNIEAVVIDPYQGQPMEFSDEQTAYQYFMKNVGLAHYQRIISDTTFATSKPVNSKPVNIVAFSVGASALWAISETTNNVRSAMCFYGSQIRHYRDINPSFPIQLWFPRQEPHFDVLALRDSLQATSNVKAHSLPYLHGFMNKNSPNFDEVGYQRGLRLIQSFLTHE